MSEEDNFNSKNQVWVPDADHVFLRGYISDNDKNSTETKVTYQKSSQEMTITIPTKDLEPCNPSKFNKCDDMAELTHLNEPSVIYNLQLRYNDDLIYTYSGLFLVAINPYKNLKIYENSILKKYHSQQYDKPPPHIFAIAEGTYRNLLTNRKDQSILVTGESGAGKTENTKKIIQYLSSITPSDIKQQSNASNKNIDTKILQANPILESFGNAKTIKNNNSSRFGKFIKIYFSNDGIIDGATIDYYLLEKSRVVYQSEQERNYHVFYQFLKGQSDSKLSDLQLIKDLNHYEYLNKSKFDIANIDDSKDFNSLVDAFDIMGFSEFESNNIFSILAIILHLGNLNFTSWKSEQANFTSESPIDIIVKLLGIDKNDFTSNLLRPKVKAGREFVSKLKKPSEVKYVIDAFAKHLYEKIFQYIIFRINDNLKTDNIDEFNYNSIGVLDIAGFEIFQVNSFEQLCINFTNEKLQQFFNHHSFILEQSEYLRENINWEFIDFGQDLQPTIDLIETKKPMGILEILNEECMIPKSSDKSFMEKLADCWGNGKLKKFNQNKIKSGFIIHHYAGKVEYNVDNWLQKNTDPVSENITNLLPNSTNAFVVDLFSKRQEDDDLQEQETVVANSSPKKRSGNGQATRKLKTASQKHKEQLNDLMDQLSSTEPHFVRCILPNLNKKPNRFDKKLVLHQLRCNGVLEGIRITRAGYPNKMVFEEFFNRYSILNEKDLVFTKNMKTNSELILKNLSLDKDVYKIGITKIFFKNGILGQLEDLRELQLTKIFTDLQKIVRGNLARSNFKSQIQKIQASQLIAKNLNDLSIAKSSNPWFNLFLNIKPLLEDSVKMLDSKEMNENLKTINGKLKDTENAKNHLENENSTLKNSIKNLEDEIIRTNDLMKDKSTKLDKLMNEEKISVKKFNDLERQISELKTLNEKLIKEKLELQENLTSTKKQISTNTNEVDSIQSQHKLSLNRIKQLETQIKNFEQTKSSHDSIISNLKKEHESSRSLISNESLKLRETNRQLSKDLDSAQKELMNEKNALSKIEMDLSKALKDKKAFQRENDSLKKQLADVNKDITKHQELEKSIKSDQQKQQALMKELKQAQEELSKQIEENESIQVEFEKLTKKHDMTNSANKTYYNQIEELNNKLKEMEERNQEKNFSSSIGSNSSFGRSINSNNDPQFIDDFANIKLKLNEQSAILRKEKFENKKLNEEISILKNRLTKNNLNASVHGSPMKENRRSLAIGEEIKMKTSNNEIETLKFKLEQEEANAIRAENYAIELQKKLNKIQSTRGINSYTDYEKKYKESQNRINDLEQRYEKMLNNGPSNGQANGHDYNQPNSPTSSLSGESTFSGQGSTTTMNTRPLSRSGSLGFGIATASNSNGANTGDFAKIYQDITRTLRTTREELSTSKMEILRLKSLLRESEEELYEVKRSNFKTSVGDYENELAQWKVKHDTINVKNEELSKSLELYKRRSEEYYKKLEMAELAVNISKRHEEQATKDLVSYKSELTLLREELKTSMILIKDLRKDQYGKEEIINDKTFRIQQLETMIKTLEDKLGYINENYGDSKNLEEKYKEDIRQLHKELNFKLEKETELIKENKQLQLDLEELIEEKKQLDEEYEGVIVHNEELEVANTELNSKLRLIEGEFRINERKINNLNKQVENLKKFNNELIKEKDEIYEIRDSLEEELNNKINEYEILDTNFKNSEQTSKILREHLENTRTESSNIKNELNQLKMFNSSEQQDYLKVLKEKLVINEENDSLKKTNRELTSKVETLEEKLFSNEQLKYWENKVNILQEELDESQTVQHEQLKKMNNLERNITNLQIRIDNELKLTKKYNDENFNYQNQIHHFKSTIDMLHQDKLDKNLLIKDQEREINDIKESMLILEKENLQMRQRLGI